MMVRVVENKLRLAGDVKSQLCSVSVKVRLPYDVDPQQRKSHPDFYGYIPDRGSRTVSFGCMLINSALMLLIRSFSAGMLILVNKWYFVTYMVTDMAL